jgi:hypothetical protein
VYGQEYRDTAEALASIREFVDRIYNQRRLHSALGRRRISNGFKPMLRKNERATSEAFSQA